MQLRAVGAITVAAAVVATGAFGVTGSSAFTTGVGSGASISWRAGPAPITAAVATPAIFAPADMVIGEADGTIDLAVTLSEEGENTVTVDYATVNSTAAFSAMACNSDYIGTSGTLTFAPGEMSKVVQVQILDCLDVELFEAFTLVLSAPSNGTISRASGRISIVDNDTVVATPRLFVRDAVVDEKDGVARVPVLLGGPAGRASNSTVTVDYDTSEGTAGSGSDYTTASGTLSFAPGQTAKTVVIPIADDTSGELSESFTLDLSSASNATISDAAGTVVIGPSDATASAAPRISAPADSVVGEADGYVDLVVGLSAPSGNTVSVDYATANSTAAFSANACNSDYIGVTGTLTFAPGETTKVARVQVLDCNDDEKLEAFTLRLSTPLNGAISRASGRISIVNNDTVVATPRLFVRDEVVDEQDGFARVAVLLGGPGGQVSSSTVTVDYATANGTASAAADYTASAGTLTFAPGETAKTVVVAIADDGAAEPSEHFALGLSNATGATISDNSGTVLIGASDAATSSQPALFAPADLLVGESEGFVDLVVRLSVPGTQEVSVDYETANSTAAFSANACNGDYIGVTGTLTFAPGETTKVVRVQILDCDDEERLEAFTLVLSDPGNGAIARASGRISIVDNHTVVATPRLFVRDAVVDEKDGTAFVSVLLGGTAGQASNSTVTVDYATTDGTAGAPSDYTASAGTLTFAPGETAKTVPVAIADDAGPELSERFALGLSNPTNATISDGTGVVAIGPSDTTATSQPGISATADLVVGEADGYVDLAVILSAPSGNSVSVNYATANSTAAFSANACNGDYIGVTGTLTFAPGETTKVVRVQILDCDDEERLEAFTFVLSAAVNGAIARTSGRISIVDNETVVATPKLIVRDGVVDERDGFALVSVLLGGPGGQASNSTVTVGYATGDATASAGADYTASAGTLTFAPGETAKTVVIAIADDGATEASENFTLGLSGATNATIEDGTGTVVIGASDAGATSQPGIFAPANVAVGERDGFVDLAVRLSAPGQNTVSVSYATVNETAAFSANACNSDYIGVSGTLTFAPGETTKVVRVQILDCPVVEGLETFRFELSAAVNGAIARTSGRVTILDNANAPTLTGIAVTPAAPSVAVGGDMQFTATATYSDASTGDLTDSVTWSSASAGVATIGAGGLAHGVGAGTSTISATLGALSGSTVLTVVGAGLSSQSISFAALADKTFGAADFTVSATASSGLQVSFTAGGNCTVSGATVHITGAGSCTITASQPGDASYAPAPSVSRTFSIAKAGQTITFAPLANKRLGDSDFTVSATASSGLAVAFGAGGRCTIVGARVHLTGAGSCTVTASQPGNANYNAAPAVSRSFSIANRKATQVKCRVPRVISKQLATAKTTIKRRHCRTGKVTRVYSRAKRKGVVIRQSRRPGKVLPANSKINLVVSRGRRR